MAATAAIAALAFRRNGNNGTRSERIDRELEQLSKDKLPDWYYPVAIVFVIMFIYVLYKSKEDPKYDPIPTFLRSSSSGFKPMRYPDHGLYPRHEVY